MHGSAFRIRNKELRAVASHCRQQIGRSMAMSNLTEIIATSIGRATSEKLCLGYCAFTGRISVFPYRGRGCRSTSGVSHCKARQGLDFQVWTKAATIGP